MLHLYKSRIDFFDRTTKNKIDDSSIRSARKELKQAMEIFQHKLRQTTNDSNSLASSYSEETGTGGGSGASSNNRSSTKSPTPLLGGTQSFGNNNNSSNMTRVLQSQNQAALNLKANTEQLKGNIKKSLILCAEATNSNADNGTTSTGSE